jgi:DNA-binding NarL/FixJ family response regulator
MFVLDIAGPHKCYLRVVSSVTTLTLEPPTAARPHVDVDIRVLIVAAVRLYGDGIAASLGRIERLAVVGTARSRVEALDLVARRTPDVLVLDAATGESIDLVRTLQTTVPTLKTLAFGVEGHEREIIAFAEAGVAGYVPSDAPIEALTSAIAGVMKGDLVCPPLVAATLLRHVGTNSAGPRPARPAVDLTARELEVLSLIDAGLSNKEIAGRLHIEVATVKNHVHHLLEKLHVTSRAEAAALFKPRRTSQ